MSAVSAKAGANSIELASTLDRAALFAQVMNDYVRAEADLRQAIEIREKRNDPSDFEWSDELTLLGNLCRMRNRSKEAIESYQRAIRTHEGDRHNDLSLISPLEQLGLLYQDAHRYEEAKSTLLRLLDLMESHFGLGSPQLASPLSKLADLYHLMGETTSEARMRERLQAVQAAQSK